MKTTMRTTFGMVLLAGVFLSAAFVYAQGNGPGQQNPQKPPAPSGQDPTPAKPPVASEASPPPVNAEEEAAYKTIFELKPAEFARQIQLGEEFLKKYPDSLYRESVYSRLAGAYLSAGEIDKMLAAGEKALELNKDDVDVLALMALVIPRRVNPAALDGNQKLQRAETYAKRTIELLAALPKPPNLTDEDFAKVKNAKLSMCHSGLGFVYFHRQNYADSVTEFEQAAQLASPPDPVDLFLLGLVLNETKRFADAAAAFGRCSDLGGPMQERCKQGMEDARKRASARPAPPKP